MSHSTKHSAIAVCKPISNLQLKFLLSLENGSYGTKHGERKQKYHSKVFSYSWRG